jgi:hypothetical protein
MKGKNLYWGLIIVLALVITFIIPRVTYTASSENYAVPVALVSEGGGAMEGTKYATVSAHGHPVSGERMKGTNYAISSGFIAAALPAIEAIIDIDPDTLNLRSEGKWITCYVTLPEGYPVDVFDPTAVALTRVNGGTLETFIYSDLEAIPPKRAAEKGNYPEEDEVQFQESLEEEMLKVKLSRSEVQAVVPLGDEVELTVTGNLLNGAFFQGTDVIRVIDPGEQKGNLTREGDPERESKKGK